MPLVRAMRMINAVEAGTLSGPDLETLLSDAGRQAELNVILDMPGQAKRMLSGSTTMKALTGSTTAFSIINTKEAFLEDIINSSTVYNNEDTVYNMVNNITALQKISSLKNIKGAFNASASTVHSAKALTDKKIIVAYVISGVLYVCVVKIENHTLVYGTAVSLTVNSGTSSIATLTSDTAIITYYNATNNRIEARILSVDDTTITANTALIVAPGGAAITSVKISSSTVLFCYTVASVVKAVVLTADFITLTVSAGTEISCYSVNSIYNSVVLLSDTKAILCFYGTTGYGTACVITISGTTLSVGTPVVFHSVATAYVSVVKLTDSLALVCYRNDSSTYGTACLLTVSGTTITPGTPTAFNVVATSYVKATAFSTNKVLVLFYVGSATVKYCVLTITDSTISFSALETLNTVTYDPSILAVTKMAGYRIAVAFQATSTYGNVHMIGVS